MTVLEQPSRLRNWFRNERHLASILSMPKRCETVETGPLWLPLQRRYHRLHRELLKVESELNEIMKECPEKTAHSFLEYGRFLAEPYGPSSPCEPDAEDWQIVLADFYAEQANDLLKQREDLLKRLYATASRIYKYRGKPTPLSYRFPHFRLPWFYDTYRSQCPNCGRSFVIRTRSDSPKSKSLRCKFCNCLISVLC